MQCKKPSAEKMPWARFSFQHTAGMQAHPCGKFKVEDWDISKGNLKLPTVVAERDKWLYKTHGIFDVSELDLPYGNTHCDSTEIAESEMFSRV